MKYFARLALLFVVLFVPSALLASSFTITFDALTDGDFVTTQFAGLTFTYAAVLTAGISLNEFEFPPVSGNNVIFDDGGGMFISFASPITDFSAFFTHSLPITLQGLDAGNSVVVTAASIFSNNQALSGVPGSSPNENLHVSRPSGISSIRITGDPSGGSFTMDNLTYAPLATAVPEPNSICLLITGIVGLIGFRKKFQIL